MYFIYLNYSNQKYMYLITTKPLLYLYYFRSALASEKETITIYKSQLGDEHDKTKESGDWGVSECIIFYFEFVVII